MDGFHNACAPWLLWFKWSLSSVYKYSQITFGKYHCISAYNSYQSKFWILLFALSLIERQRGKETGLLDKFSWKIAPKGSLDIIYHVKYPIIKDKIYYTYLNVKLHFHPGLLLYREARGVWELAAVSNSPDMVRCHQPQKLIIATNWNFLKLFLLLHLALLHINIP